MMSTVLESSRIVRTDHAQLPRDASASITWEASKQTYYTIRFLVDRDRVRDAYRAYGYFRWLDNQLDQGALDLPARTAFVERQQTLIERCYRGDQPRYFSEEEEWLVNLIRSDTERYSGLQSYVRHMMAVMAFDARRRGQLVSADELNQYTRWLATAVTEAMHYFIGHGSRSPQGEMRYLAVTAAHITHMLRDTLEDAEAGYYNIPRETVEAHRIDPREVSSVPYQAWVRSRVHLARRLFASGREYLSQVENPRSRLAGYAYMARFEGVLDSIEQDGYQLRAAYPERKSLVGVIRMGWFALTQTFNQPHPHNLPS
ncbi:MAG TPA: squalene/phytoene synthase family protein, partial [Aggregatilineaceae bacterium]|nr:squalene/phytoene synthase family protein [Aggregatilineaceae bacterium]